VTCSKLDDGTGRRRTTEKTGGARGDPSQPRSNIAAGRYLPPGPVASVSAKTSRDMAASRFVVVDAGHDRNVEVAEQHDRYAIVEKDGLAGRIAEEEDPRR